MTLTIHSRAMDLLIPYQRFVVFGTAPKSGKPGALDKFPIDAPSGKRLTQWEQPHRWMPFEQAFTFPGRDRGVGIVIAPPLHFLDIDNCIINGIWDSNAIALVQMFPGAYCEISLSGTGLHVIFRGTLPEHSSRCTWFSMGLELYSERRFCALTGNTFYDHGNTELPDHSESGARLAALFPPKAAEQSDTYPAGPMTAPRHPEDDDAALIARARGVRR